MVQVCARFVVIVPHVKTSRVCDWFKSLYHHRSFFQTSVSGVRFRGRDVIDAQTFDTYRVVRPLRIDLSRQVIMDTPFLLLDMTHSEYEFTCKG